MTDVRGRRAGGRRCRRQRRGPWVGMAFGCRHYRHQPRRLRLRLRHGGGLGHCGCRHNRRHRMAMARSPKHRHGTHLGPGCGPYHLARPAHGFCRHHRFLARAGRGRPCGHHHRHHHGQRHREAGYFAWHHRRRPRHERLTGPPSNRPTHPAGSLASHASHALATASAEVHRPRHSRGDVPVRLHALRVVKSHPATFGRWKRPQHLLEGRL
mmetsp:Transcript_40560/g.130413  ORF Transcript_40560/g.130413 Transcript_40560/m.130413 type:complete len:211 (+) Transcript_40560:361-993(+)